ncbi:MAG: DUF302 domain-containing protein [Syntrophales bacterium]|jgi:uncharacterized protein (DUF302 family)|nr:DUF302 domain-containing protein [Syntrophales bacterium]MCK9528903.1 DUF302 domain-containing protein [Syntrophales bacterium]MDX9922815.1 DUF302 domain-containing protein [Syntrophales bacterium]
MKKTLTSRHIIPLLTIFITVSLLGIGMIPGNAAARETATDQPQLVQVIQSQKSFAETLRTFKEEVAKAGWSVLNANNMAGVLSERGFTLHPVVILDVCSGKYSARILSRDEYRPISAFMPCRVSIYQTSDGSVFVARMNTNAFVHLMPPEASEVMSASDEEIDRIISAAIR